MLNHNQNIFSITFNVMNKSLQGKVEYAYKLEGLEENWINIGGYARSFICHSPLRLPERYQHYSQPQPHRIQPVSYTHLDVYKRQVFQVSFSGEFQRLATMLIHLPFITAMRGYSVSSM